MQQTLKQQYKCNHTAFLDFAGTQQRCKSINWKVLTLRPFPRRAHPKFRAALRAFTGRVFFCYWAHLLKSLPIPVFLKERHRSLGNCFSFLPLHLHKQKLAHNFLSNPRSREQPREHPGTAQHRGCPTIPSHSYLTLTFQSISVAIQPAATPQHTTLTSLPGCVLIITTNN